MDAAVTGEARGRRIVRERCGGRCERCGAPGPTIHHRRKRSQGGTWCPSNLIALCGGGVTGCHGWVEANPAAAHAAGLWLRHGENAAERPVWVGEHAGGQRVLLDPEGMYLPAE